MSWVVQRTSEEKPSILWGFSYSETQPPVHLTEVNHYFALCFMGIGMQGRREGTVNWLETYSVNDARLKCSTACTFKGGCHYLPKRGTHRKAPSRKSWLSRNLQSGSMVGRTPEPLSPFSFCSMGSRLSGGFIPLFLEACELVVWIAGFGNLRCWFL